MSPLQVFSVAKVAAVLLAVFLASASVIMASSSSSSSVSSHSTQRNLYMQPQLVLVYNLMTGPTLSALYIHTHQYLSVDGTHTHSMRFPWSRKRPRPIIREHIQCPWCKSSHIDKGRLASFDHVNHLCEHCSHVFTRPRASVGVPRTPHKNPPVALNP